MKLVSWSRPVSFAHAQEGYEAQHGERCPASPRRQSSTDLMFYQYGLRESSASSGLGLGTGTYYSNRFPFVSGNCVATTHASRNDAPHKKNAQLRPFACPTCPMTNGAIELMVRAPL